MSESLNMEFMLTNGKKWTLEWPNPAYGLTKSQVETVMNDIIAKKAFSINEATPASVVKCYTRTVNDKVLS